MLLLASLLLSTTIAQPPDTAATTGLVRSADCSGDLEQLHQRQQSRAIEGSASFAWYEWAPGVMRADRPEASPMVLRAKVVGTITSARLTLSNSTTTVTLLDNGVAPDTVAGDGIFSGNVSPQAIKDRNSADRVQKPFVGGLEGLSGGTGITGLYNVFAHVLPSDALSIPIQNVNASIRRTPWLINVRDDAFINDFNRERVTQTAYTVMPDLYQFVHVVYGPQQHISNRFHGVIRNNVSGIGLGTIDTGASWGSASALLGFTVFPNWTFYDMQNRGFLHETGHQWAVHFTTGLLADPVNSGHWPIGTMANHVMGISLQGGAGGFMNCQLSSTGANVSTQQVAQSTYYNALELYLMGMLPISLATSYSVNDQTTARNVVLGGGNWCNGTTYNWTAGTVSQSYMTTTYGARNPSFASSRKNYRAMTVVASSGRTLSDDELRYLSWFNQRANTPGLKACSEGFTTNASCPTFFDATGGVGNLDFLQDATFANGFE